MGANRLWELENPAFMAGGQGERQRTLRALQVEAMKRKEAYERSQALERIQEETERARELVAKRAQLQVYATWV